MCVPVKIIMWTHLLPSHIDIRIRLDVSMWAQETETCMCVIYEIVIKQASTCIYEAFIGYIWMFYTRGELLLLNYLFEWLWIDFYTCWFKCCFSYMYTVHTRVQAQRNYENFSNTYKIKPNVCFTFNYICSHGIMSQFSQKWNQILTHAWFSQLLLITE